jgi:hypothetical protein
MNPRDREGNRAQQTAWWERRAQAVTVILVFVLVVFLVQLWLLGIAVEEWMAERHGLALPTFLASGFCFLLNLAFLRYLRDLDRDKGT